MQGLNIFIVMHGSTVGSSVIDKVFLFKEQAEQRAKDLTAAAPHETWVAVKEHRLMVLTPSEFLTLRPMWGHPW